MSTLKIGSALLAGMAAGAVLGLLLAPNRGSKTRDELADSLSDFADMTIQTATDGFGKMLEALNLKFNTLEQEELPDDLEHA